jgi:hypothetical protein
VAASSCQWFPLVYGVSQTSLSWAMSRSCGMLEVVAADVDQGKGVWGLHRSSTMRVNIGVLVCKALELFKILYSKLGGI